MFDVNADWEPIARRLRADPLLRSRLFAKPGLHLPGCWDGFELATRVILGQRVTVKGATQLAGRLVRSFGRQLSAPHGLTHLFPEPRVLADAKLASIGLPASRAEAIQHLARAVSSHEIDFNTVTDSYALLSRLGELPGIGNWTTQYVAMRALGEPDAFPAGDIGLLRALRISSPRALHSIQAGPWVNGDDLAPPATRYITGCLGKSMLLRRAQLPRRRLALRFPANYCSQYPTSLGATKKMVNRFNDSML